MNRERMREQFEVRFPVPCGMRWVPGLGADGHGDYVMADHRLCSGDRAARYCARWETWQAAEVMLMWDVNVSKSELLESAIRNLEPTHRAGTPRWALVRDAFATGSTVATALCRKFGFDPEEYLSTDPNYATDAKVMKHLRSVDGSTAWAMSGPLGMERVDVSKSLYRLKRRGLVATSEGSSRSYWRACW